MKGGDASWKAKFLNLQGKLQKYYPSLCSVVQLKHYNYTCNSILLYFTQQELEIGLLVQGWS